MLGESLHFDERQLAARGRISTHCFTLALLVIMVNGLFNKMVGQWASVFDQSMLLFWVLFFIFAAWTMFEDAFFTSNAQRRRFLWMYAVVGGLNLLAGLLNFLEGKGWAWMLALGGLGFLLVVAVGWWKVLAEKRSEEE